MYKEQIANELAYRDQLLKAIKKLNLLSVQAIILRIDYISPTKGIKSTFHDKSMILP